MLDNLNGPPEVFLGPDLEALVMGVGPHQQDRREQEVEAGEQEPAAGLVMEVGRVDLDLEEVALGVDQHLALAAGDLLAAVVAARTAGLGGLDRLAVKRRRARLAFAAPGDAIVFAQDLVDPLPGPGPAPLAQ